MAKAKQEEKEERRLMPEDIAESMRYLFAVGGDKNPALAIYAARKAVEKAIQKAGGEIINVKNNEEGVRIEK